MASGNNMKPLVKIIDNGDRQMKNPTYKDLPLGWKSIESAPVDGSSVLLLGNGGRIADGHYMKSARGGSGAWVWAYVRKEPTHWMSCPEGPKE